MSACSSGNSNNNGDDEASKHQAEINENNLKALQQIEGLYPISQYAQNNNTYSNAVFLRISALSPNKLRLEYLTEEGSYFKTEEAEIVNPATELEFMLNDWTVTFYVQSTLTISYINYSNFLTSINGKVIQDFEKYTYLLSKRIDETYLDKYYLNTDSLVFTRSWTAIYLRVANYIYNLSNCKEISEELLSQINLGNSYAENWVELLVTYFISNENVAEVISNGKLDDVTVRFKNKLNYNVHNQTWTKFRLFKEESSAIY